MIHHAFVISAFSESDSMLPQEITSSGRPIPIKLSVDSATIALRMFITTINIIACQTVDRNGIVAGNGNGSAVVTTCTGFCISTPDISIYRATIANSNGIAAGSGSDSAVIGG